MSETRSVWADSIKANRGLIENRATCEAAFHSLLKKHPNDRMIYFTRAEAYESLVEYDLAHFDYMAAAQKFPFERWQKMALAGATRVKLKRESSVKLEEITRDSPSFILHRIHDVLCLPYEISVDALSAIPKFDGEPHIAAAQLRSCLERLVSRVLEKGSVAIKGNADLVELIKRVETEDIAPSEIVKKMHDVRILGNQGIHIGLQQDEIDFRASMRAFADIVEWFGGFSDKLSRATD